MIIAATAEQALLKLLAMGQFACNIFRLFEAVDREGVPHCGPPTSETFGEGQRD